MSRLSEIFNKYLKKYVSTRTVFAMDMIISAAASFLAALLSSIVSHSDIFDLGHAGHHPCRALAQHQSSDQAYFY